MGVRQGLQRSDTRGLGKAKVMDRRNFFKTVGAGAVAAGTIILSMEGGKVTAKGLQSKAENLDFRMFVGGVDLTKYVESFECEIKLGHSKFTAQITPDAVLLNKLAAVDDLLRVELQTEEGYQTVFTGHINEWKDLSNMFLSEIQAIGTITVIAVTAWEFPV